MANEAVGTVNPGEATPGAGDNTQNPNPITATGPTPAGTGVEGAEPKQPKEKFFQFKEDRSDWIPRNRLAEEAGKRTKLEQQVQELRDQHELAQKRLRLAMGLEVPSKDEQELTEMREALYKLNPKLKLLDSLDEEALERILSAAESAQHTTQVQWSRHRDEMLSNLSGEVADLVNVDKLSDSQRARLERDFKAYASEQNAKRMRAEKSQDPTYDYDNDFVSRYERGDKTLLTEFAKQFVEDWITPVRRQSNASAVNRINRPVPRGERTRQTVTQGPPKIDYNNDDAFKAAMLSARQGGEGGV